MVNTLLRRARDIPSSEAEKVAETIHVKKVLKENNYPDSSVRRCESQLDKSPGTDDQTRPNGMVVLPYIAGVSERLSRVLRPYNIQVAHRTTRNINNLFPRPKGVKDPILTTGAVYKINCSDCEFVYYGQTERSLKMRVSEHRRAVCQNLASSKIAEHVHNTDHEINFGSVRTVTTETNFHQRLFLEAWFSELDPNSGNFRSQIPALYKSLLNSWKRTR